MKVLRFFLFIVPVAAMTALFFNQIAPAAPRTAAIAEPVRGSSDPKAVPGELTYQGFLADAADSSAVTADLEMTFRLFDSETKGAELWSETHPAVEVAGGLFQVQLGALTPFPPGLFDGTPLWLQTEAGMEIFSPRKPLGSVAYSHRSNSAEMLLDLTLMDLDDRWVNEGQVDAVTSDMVVDGAGSGLDADMVDGQHAADFITMGHLYHLDAADGDPTNAVYVNDAGLVGVGTTAPARNLHIFEDDDGVVGIDIENPSTGSSSIEMITFTDENGGVAGIATYDKGSSYPSAMRMYNNRPDGTIGLVTDSFERIRVSSDGKVGIGTITPAYTLDVNGAVNAATYWGDGSNLTGIAGSPDADWTVSNDTIYHQTGVVGIGTACPAYPLHVHDYSAYSPAYAAYFHAIGHEATGNAYAVYAEAQADDENAYGIYSTATSTWGRAYAGYFDGNVKADSIFLGSSSKAGQHGGLLLYNDGSTNPVVELGRHSDVGGKATFRDSAGYWYHRVEPDIDGEGGFFMIYRNNFHRAFRVDGNYAGTEEPRVTMQGSFQSADFFMGKSGDSSVVLPDDAVSAGEIKDEPGVANHLGSDYYWLNSGLIDYAVDSVSITIPGPGYVEITGGCYIGLYHTVGTDTRVYVVVDKTAANADFTFPGAQIAGVPSNVATSVWGFPCTTTRLYEETTGGTKTYYLNAEYNSGTNGSTQVDRSYIRAVYYPTLYGTVTVAETDGAGGALSAAQGSWDGTARGPEPRRRSITVDDHNARLEAEMATLRAELEALKEEMENQK
jgi:hypothetical protein